jgi:TM2 domain-containing membrane protein YozV
MAFCSNCGAEFEGNFCNVCGQGTGQAMQVRQVVLARPTEKHGVPALLSFFIPGLGQLVKGHIGKGVVVFFGMIASVALMYAAVGFITTPIVWVWQIYDAYTAN